MSRRVALVSILHESNTFAPGLTGYEDFQSGFLMRGEEIATYSRGGKSALAGALSVFDAQGWTPVPILFANTTPGPVVSDDALQRLWAIAEEELKAAGPVDAVYIAQHGAAVSEKIADLDGWWLSRLRERVGPGVPIMGTLDPHCFITEAMVKAADVLLPFKTNPHLDAFERGAKAATLIVRTVNGEIRPVQRFCLPPMIINIEQQHTGSEPLLSFCQGLSEEESTEAGGVLDASLILGYPYSDLPEMGSGVQVVTDGNAGLARSKALELGERLWEARETMLPSLHAPAEAFALAEEAPKPVCLLDMGDNIGGGASGEGTWLLPFLMERPGAKSFFAFYDPTAAQTAIEAGVGAKVTLSLGGKGDPALEGPAVTFTGVVKAIPPHQYHDTKVRHGGRKDFFLGPNALLVNEAGTLHLLLTSVRASPNSMGLMTNAGVHPKDVDLIVAKGVNAPLAAFDGHCTSFIKVNTPGSTSADLGHFTFHNLRKPFHPFDTGFTADLVASLMPADD